MLGLLLLFIYLYIITLLTGAAAAALLGRLLKTGPDRILSGPVLFSARSASGSSSASVSGGAAKDRPVYSLTVTDLCMAGLAVCTVYAEAVSLFAGLGHPAVHIPLIAVSAIAAWRLHAGRYIRTLSRSGALYAVFFLLLFSYGTSRGIIHTDTGLYHAQSIRWALEYGTVPGLANLHLRLGYNSAAFPLTALFSLAYPGAQAAGSTLGAAGSAVPDPLHGVGGFMAMLLAMECFAGIRMMCRGSFRISDLCRLSALYYLFGIFDEMISPASDYFLCIGVFYLVIRFLDASGGREAKDSPAEGLLLHSLLSLFGVFLVSVKLSAVMIVLLSFYTLYLILRARRFRVQRILLLLLAGSLVLAPFLARNVVQTGYLLYPFPQIDLFSFDFKVPWGDAMYDQLEISVWGKGIRDVLQADMPVRGWFPAWFAGLSGLEKCLFLLDAAAVLLVPVLLLARMLRARRKPAVSVWIAYAALAASFGYWFTSAPLIRYGCVYVYLLAAFAFGVVLQSIPSVILQRADAAWRAAGRAFRILAVLFLCYKCVMLAKEQFPVFAQPYWLWQKGYGTYETVEYEIGGIPFYYAADGGATGFDAFPSSPREAAVELRGNGLRDGFRPAAETAGSDVGE